MSCYKRVWNFNGVVCFHKTDSDTERVKKIIVGIIFMNIFVMMTVY